MSYLDKVQVGNTTYDVQDSNAQAMVAPAYSTSSTYAVGDYVTRTGKLYRCISAITTAEAWTAAHWSEVTVGAEVSDLKSAISVTQSRLSKYDGIVNLDAYFEIGNIGISTSGWTYNDNTTRVRTKQNTAISFNAGDVISISGSAVKFYVGYRINGTYYTAGWQTSDYICPVTAEYALCIEHVPVSQITDISDVLQYFTFISDDRDDKILYGLRDKVNDLSNLLSGRSYRYGYYDGSGVFVPGSSSGTNKEVTYDDIEAIPGAVYYFNTKVIGNSSWIAVTAFGGNNAFISRTTSNAQVEGDGYYYGYMIYKCPYNAKTLSVSFRSFHLTNFYALFMPLAMERNASVSIPSNIKAIAHRGAEYGAPENTKYAFTLAKDLGFLYVEGDVSFTSDGVPVLLHDTTINRTARNADGSTISGTLTLADMTFSEANQYDYGIFKGEMFAGVGIPTFTDWIIQCKKIGVRPYIEIKTNVSITQEMVNGLVATVRRYGMLDNSTWISTSTDVLDKVATALPNGARLGALSDITETAVGWATTKRTAGYDAFIDTASANVTSENCVTCADANVPLEAWTLYTAESIYDLDPYVSGVTSDAMIATSANLERYKLNGFHTFKPITDN